MRIILLSFFLLFNFSTYVISCQSSGDGDCVPSTNTSKKSSYKSSSQAISETSDTNTLSNYNNEKDGGLPDDHIAKPSSYLKKINEKSKLSSKIKKLKLKIVILTFSFFYLLNFWE